MVNIETKITEDSLDDFNNIIILNDYLIDKLLKNKCKKEDRMLLIDAVALLYEMAENRTNKI